MEGASLGIGPALYAQSEVSEQRHNVGAGASHNICCLGRHKRLLFGNGKFAFFVTSKPTINRSSKP